MKKRKIERKQRNTLKYTKRQERMNIIQDTSHISEK